MIESSTEIQNITIKNCMITELSSSNNMVLYPLYIKSFLTGFTFEDNYIHDINSTKDIHSIYISGMA